MHDPIKTGTLQSIADQASDKDFQKIKDWIDQNFWDNPVSSAFHISALSNHTQGIYRSPVDFRTPDRPARRRKAKITAVVAAGFAVFPRVP